MEKMKNSGSFPNIAAEAKQFMIQMLCEDMIDCSSTSVSRE
jgi:hypothetical protein